MEELQRLLDVEIRTLLPSEGAVDAVYKIEGSVKIFEAIGAPPWVYAEVKKKDWYKPDILEEVTYQRGFPLPISGDFTIEWSPEKIGIYEVTVVATPAPLPLPVIGVPPIVGKSDMMKITVVEKPARQATDFKIVSYEAVTA